MKSKFHKWTLPNFSNKVMIMESYFMFFVSAWFYGHWRFTRQTESSQV